MEDNRVYPSYSVMIRQLFKPMATVNDQLMHAAIGVSGEVAELFSLNSWKNIVEECGDIEFYVEALKQQFEPDFASAMVHRTLYKRESITLQNVFGNMAIIAGEILDLAKKSWVYTKELDRGKMTFHIMMLEMNLERMYEILQLSRADIQHTNKVKLIGPGGRFESGFYSDTAAIARADKVGEDRNFIGKK
jgi:hypothetical protein